MISIPLVKLRKAAKRLSGFLRRGPLPAGTRLGQHEPQGFDPEVRAGGRQKARRWRSIENPGSRRLRTVGLLGA